MRATDKLKRVGENTIVVSKRWHETKEKHLWGTCNDGHLDNGPRLRIFNKIITEQDGGVLIEVVKVG